MFGFRKIELKTTKTTNEIYDSLCETCHDYKTAEPYTGQEKRFFITFYGRYIIIRRKAGPVSSPLFMLVGTIENPSNNSDLKRVVFYRLPNFPLMIVSILYFINCFVRAFKGNKHGVLEYLVVLLVIYILVVAFPIGKIKTILKDAIEG